MGKSMLGGLLGGLVLFAWGALFHMALPWAHAGMRELAPEHEAALGAALQASCGERGIYGYPAYDLDGKMTAEAEEAFMARYDAGPAAFVVYQPDPPKMMGAKQLGLQFAADLAAALLVAHLARRFGAGVSYLGKVALIGSIGLIAVLGTDASQCIWYGFPCAHFFSRLVLLVVGWLLAGLVIARYCKT